MAKLIEELIVIKLSRMVKDNNASSTVVDEDKRALIEETIPTLVEEVINDDKFVNLKYIFWALARRISHNAHNRFREFIV